jgi:hypothetical protein
VAQIIQPKPRRVCCLRPIGASFGATTPASTGSYMIVLPLNEMANRSRCRRTSRHKVQNLLAADIRLHALATRPEFGQEIERVRARLFVYAYGPGICCNRSALASLSDDELWGTC